MTTRRSSLTQLRATVETDRGRIASHERPRYHARFAASPFDGSADVTIVELPIIHLFVPDADAVLDGARVLIARTLGVDADAFDIELERPTDAR